MRFALLCDDLTAKPIIKALSEKDAGNQFVYAVRATEQTDALLHGIPNVEFLDRWEDLLVSNEVDAVIVGGSDPNILEGAKQLATAGTPILFVPNADQGSTFIYELSLIRDDNHSVLWPLFLHRYDNAVLHLKQCITDGRLGKLQFLQLQRGNPVSPTGTPIPNSVIDREFLDDVDLPRWLVGDYNQVTCLRTATTDQDVQIQSVVLAGRSLPETHWTMNATETAHDWRLTVRGDAGAAVLHRINGSRCWTCETGNQIVTGNERESARAALQAFALSLPRNQPAATDDALVKESHSWDELIKCFETVDATHRSLRRRRTIELHFEPMSERAIFKSQMTAIGCSLLVITFFLTLTYLGIASIVPLPSWALILMRTLVFSPLVLFLIAQVLLPLTRPSSSESTSQN